jgi:hypothetical protein
VRPATRARRCHFQHIFEGGKFLRRVIQSVRADLAEAMKPRFFSLFGAALIYHLNIESATWSSRDLTKASEDGSNLKFRKKEEVFEDGFVGFVPWWHQQHNLPKHPPLDSESSSHLERRRSDGFFGEEEASDSGRARKKERNQLWSVWISID